MNTPQSRIRTKIGNEQYGFIQNAGTQNAILGVKILPK